MFFSSWRHLASPLCTDSDFDWEELITRHNNELLKNLGNFVNRGITFCHKNFEGKLPKLVG